MHRRKMCEARASLRDLWIGWVGVGIGIDGADMDAKDHHSNSLLCQLALSFRPLAMNESVECKT